MVPGWWSSTVYTTVFACSGWTVSFWGRVAAGQGTHRLTDVLVESGAHGRLFATNSESLVSLSSGGGQARVYGSFKTATSLAPLPDGGLVVLECSGRFVVCRGLRLRVQWIAACALCW